MRAFPISDSVPLNQLHQPNFRRSRESETYQASAATAAPFNAPNLLESNSGTLPSTAAKLAPLDRVSGYRASAQPRKTVPDPKPDGFFFRQSSELSCQSNPPKQVRIRHLESAFHFDCSNFSAVSKPRSKVSTRWPLPLGTNTIVPSANILARTIFKKKQRTTLVQIQSLPTLTQRQGKLCGSGSQEIHSFFHRPCQDPKPAEPEPSAQSIQYTIWAVQSRF